MDKNVPLRPVNRMDMEVLAGARFFMLSNHPFNSTAFNDFMHNENGLS